MTEPAPAKKLSSFQRLAIVLLSALVVAVVTVAIVVAVTARSAEVDRKKLECEQYPLGSLDYFYCMDLADN